ncbi:trypsin-like peptidase domain-containing protein [Alkalilimnicola ehrlichii]|uniref:S1C family serine protease n=1 Tax=Alkalilimnicola ehrlichii TaxID=351052 RepID=UPI002689F41B|nr:trypsin-like peptidase domain-containing protein [Alkalilimnicola ehrlichii]
METSLGSGVILSENGHILTNNHVIQGAEQIEVMLNDGRTADARLIGADPETDLAVLAIELDNLPSITLGHSDALRVGDVVLAIGNPFGVGQTVTQGIVSATGRSQLGLSTFENFIQTDAAINPGNSGGALINARGELVGINTAIFSRSGGSHGIGFAIPAELAREVLISIIEHGRVIRGWVGIEVQPLTMPLAESFGLDSDAGVIVAGVLRNGPADQAGLRPGDVIHTIDDTPVDNAQSLLRLITARPPGTEITVGAWRTADETTFETQISIHERPHRQESRR